MPPLDKRLGYIQVLAREESLCYFIISMKSFTRYFFFFVGCLLPFIKLYPVPGESLRNEIERALNKGIRWLYEEQNASSGCWGNEQYPALTSLALRSVLGHPSVALQKKYSRQIEKGFSFLRTKVQSDGGIMVKV